MVIFVEPFCSAKRKTNLIFYQTDILEKLLGVESAIDEALHLEQSVFINRNLARDCQVLKVCDLPPKPKISTREGQARLVHDLASIELQAMELALRGLYEFPEAPPQFRTELAALARDEASHLKLCLATLQTFGFQWGHWPVHTALWQSVSTEDTLLERIFIVHRYLEASGLDAGDSILTRLSGVAQKQCLATISLIVSEEVGHVEFGSRWFRYVCELENKDPEVEFARLYRQMSERSPRRERPSLKLRRLAGFSENELTLLKLAP